jgi:integral membrane sensor domain MASE1
VWKFINSFTVLAVLLFIIGAVGLVRGAEAIRDPGQPSDSWLPWLYFAAAILMVVNAILSVRHYEQKMKEQAQSSKEKEEARK